MKLITFLFFSTLFFFSCNTKISEKESKKTVDTENLLEASYLKEDEASFDLYAINASQYGVSYRETMILMQNRKGLRIEYCVDRSALEIWISPQAGKSFSYVDKNWSNRDDHTNVFDRILIPGLNIHEFDSCNWDPFHSIIYFKNQTLHLAQVYNEPAVLVWFEKPGEVDFKIVGQEVERTEKAFIINHSDRGRDFQSAAIMSNGDGEFTHQLVLDNARSIYARANLKPGQFLVITSELEKERIASIAKDVANKKINNILASNEEMIKKDLSTGLFTFKDRPEMQKLLDVNRRVALSMQDFEGFMRSTNQYIYYLLWFRDAGMNTGHLSYSGWAEPARQYVKYALLNPNTSNTEPEGEFFGMLMSGPITKWEEDGLFYVIWPTFNYWTQTGDDTFVQGEYLKTMEDAMDWLERYCYNEEVGLFGRYHYCETPYTGSRGDGFDNATGAPTYPNQSNYKDTLVVRAYDLYINILNYSNYMMLAAMEKGEKAKKYIQKAKTLEKNMQPFFDYDNERPSYGYVLTEDGKFIMTEPYGMDVWDYVWAMSLPPFTPNLPKRYQKARERMYKDMTTTTRGYFLCTYFALLTSMDPEIHEEKDLLAAMDKLVDYSIKPGKYLPMHYAMPEMFNISEENPFHDVRPLVYSIAPWMSAVTNMGIRRLPFGIAARSCETLENLDNYVYHQGLFDISFEGKGEIFEITLNGESLKNSYQIPSADIIEGENKLVIKMEENATTSNALIGSTIELISIEQQDGKAVFSIKAYGKNVLTFKNLMEDIQIVNTMNQTVDFDTKKLNNLSYIEFEGIGEFKVYL